MIPVRCYSGSGVWNKSSLYVVDRPNKLNEDHTMYNVHVDMDKLVEVKDTLLTLDIEYMDGSSKTYYSDYIHADKCGISTTIHLNKMKPVSVKNKILTVVTKENKMRHQGVFMLDN